MTVALDTPLSHEIKSVTSVAHSRAEESQFIDDLIAGRLDKVAYRNLLEQTYLFYSALECSSQALRTSPLFAELYDARLLRLPSIAKDLTALHGSARWKGGLQMLPATARYVQRLNEIGALQDPIALIAHHYVRYLGDLSGGQVIGRMMQRHYNVGSDAVNFYNFEEIEKPKPYKDSYRAKLDALVLSDEERSYLLDEAVAGFYFNSAIFKELAEV
ncbi:biliverdin-producing heme oxygenase [Corynebacterium hindlerae]|uniref:heme oxygenase (biliverdin-producing) n=1 Tax=Corynebacterium hindlerae TaxID=699041 RepID=A0A7G5FDA8_9CORY|nr:biliverdin-producing heme oxygenase [Corynebacterium hindlerae]QMV84599.1 biliverdin-producing heme oxygenase [Corynebacterium hindlerae]